MVKSILLLDDNTATNFIHRKFISKSVYDVDVVSFEMGIEALDYLSEVKNVFPELIFVDINMPTMTAWEFFTAFRKIKREEKSNAVCIILTTSLSPEDSEITKEFDEIKDIMIKPLDVNSLKQVMTKFF